MGVYWEPMDPTKWWHFIFMGSEHVSSIFVNGHENSGYVHTYDNITVSGTQFTLGKDFIGYMHDFRVYNRSFMDSELKILFNYNKPPKIEAGYYPLTKGIAGLIATLSIFAASKHCKRVPIEIESLEEAASSKPLLGRKIS